VERFLLLWDELDELAGWGWHLAAGAKFSMARRLMFLRRLRAPVPASARA
jgi:hypothetical protein